MTSPDCLMAALVEARRDARLDGRELASVERHLSACASCRTLDRDLGRLADLSRGTDGRADVSSLAHRRGRKRLLQAAAAIAARGG